MIVDSESSSLNRLRGPRAVCTVNRCRYWGMAVLHGRPSWVDCHQNEPPVEGKQVEPVREAIHRLSIYTFHYQKHTKAHQQTLGVRTRTEIKAEHRDADNGGRAGGKGGVVH